MRPTVCVCEPRTRSVRIIELHTCLPRRRWGVFSAVLLVIHWEKCAPTSHVQRCLRSCQKGSELFFSFHSVAVQEIWTDHHRRRRWGRHQFLRPTPPPPSPAATCHKLYKSVSSHVHHSLETNVVAATIMMIRANLGRRIWLDEHNLNRKLFAWAV